MGLQQVRLFGSDAKINNYWPVLIALGGNGENKRRLLQDKCLDEAVLKKQPCEESQGLYAYCLNQMRCYLFL
jgi:hypothetical protein